MSRELGTPPLPEAHSPVGYCWQNSRCCRSLREPQHRHIDDFVSHPNDPAQRPAQRVRCNRGLDSDSCRCFRNDPSSLLQLFPLIPVDPCLTQDSGQEFHVDISLMGVRNSNGDIAPDHELVFATRVGSFKSKLLEISDQIFPFDGSERRDQATSLMVSSIPSMAGKGRFQ